MKYLLFIALVSLQLFALVPSVKGQDRYKRNVNPFARPPPPPRRPIITDDLRGFNRRFARSVDDDYQAAFQDFIPDDSQLHDAEEYDRYRRNVNPFARPPPPRRPIITDDIRGANRRWARDTHLDEQSEPELYRERRDLQIPGYKKPTHRDIIIPNWNPNARTQPWQQIGVRHRRSYDSRSHASRGASHSTSSSSHDTGRTHPGYNRRNA